ncbi:hypothetical protein GCM10023231_41630 [Olivibacter ginsenosidimutans]|uniref:TolC family protein n=1 Tax=Olivibacter ginsenosidimutans TaxID=1176537 RepID=A0ABP9CFH9_9SPHI
MLKQFLWLGYGLLGNIFLCLGQAHQQPITLNELLTLVRQNAPSLVTDSTNLLIKEAQAREIYNSRLPDLNLSYQANVGSNNNVPGPYFGFGLVPTNNGGIRSSANYEAVSSNLGIAAFQWEFYNFGQYKAQDELAKAELKAAQSRFEEARYDLQSFTIYSYLQLLKYNDLIAIQARSINRNKEIHRSIMALARSGIRPGVDTSMAEAELSRARLSQIDLTNQQNQLKIRLAAISGLSAEKIVPDTVSEKILFEQIKNSPVEVHGIMQHPLINYYHALLASQQAKETLLTKSYRPKLFLSGAVWGRAASITSDSRFLSLDQGLGFQRGNYLAGLGISYNLFDRKRKQLALNTQRLLVEQSSRKLHEEQVNIETNILQASAEVDASQQRLNEIPNQIKAANAAYRQKFSLYKNGLTDIVELNVAQNILDRAERDYITAKYNYYLALFHQVIAQNNIAPFLKLFN